MTTSLLTVVTPAPSTDLTTVDAVKLDLGLTSGDGNEKFAAWVTQSSATIAKYCRRTFGKEKVMEVLRYDPLRFRDTIYTITEPKPIQLRRWPVVSVDSVVVNGETLDASEYEIDLERGLLYRLTNDTRRNWYARKVVITYTGGYDLPDGAPPDLARAAILLVKQAHHSAKRDPLVKSQEIVNIRATEYWVGGVGNGPLPPEVLALVDSYRDIRF